VKSYNAITFLFWRENTESQIILIQGELVVSDVEEAIAVGLELIARGQAILRAHLINLLEILETNFTEP